MFRKKETPKTPERTTDEISAYIKSVTLRRKLFGVSEEDVWTIASNIQKYYEKKSDKDAAVIDKLTKDLAEKEELIVKQREYIEAVRRKIQ